MNANQSEYRSISWMYVMLEEPTVEFTVDELITVRVVVV